MNFLIRNHDKTLFNKQKEDFINAMNAINNKYNNDFVSIEIKDTYSNMNEYLKDKIINQQTLF
jgi:tripeptide aminopeptidase